MLILASESTTRHRLLASAGIEFAAKAARVDEVSITQALVAEGAPARDIADTLAEYKARQIGANNPELVLGCDQVLELDGQILSKVNSMEEAAIKLRGLQNKTHFLHSAAVIYENHQPVWRSVRTARLHMRSLDDTQIENYLSQTGDDILSAVGCYHLEGLGAQLFTRVEGDYFTILGMPLLDILGFLRTRGIGL